MKQFIQSILLVMVLLIGIKSDVKAQDSLEITFSVDLSILIELGDFDPSTDTMTVAGSFTGWQDGAIALSNIIDGTYSETILIENVTVGDTLQYKFLFDTENGLYWETNFPTSSGNRHYGVTGAETDIDENGIPNVELSHNWNDFPLDILDVPSPLVAAPTPMQDPESVISLFSDVYDDVSVDTWRAGWSNSIFIDDFADGDAVKKYVWLDFNGVETVNNQLDVTNMTHFSFDLWTPNATTFRVKLVDFGADATFGGGDDSEHEIVWEKPALNEWISYDIPLSDFTSLTSTSNIAQIIFSGLPTGDVTAFIDNVYFYEENLFADYPAPPYQIGDTLNYNGSFANFDVGSPEGINEGWFFDIFNGLGTYEISSDAQDGDGKSLQVNATYNGSPDVWNIQVINDPIFPADGDLVKATFWMKATTEGRLGEAFIGLGENGGFQDKITHQFNIFTEWTEYEFEYFTDAQDKELSMRLGFKLNYPQNDGAVILIDNVQLVKQEVVLTDVNFTVNTEVQQSIGNFDPSTQSAVLVGEFNGWDVGSPIEMSAVDDVIYTTTIQLPNATLGDTLQYKFILRDDNSGLINWEAPDGATGNTLGEFDDRFFIVNDLSSIDVESVYFSDVEPADMTPSNYGITSIADARIADDFTHLAVQGIVTRITYNFLYLQDGTAATMLFSRPLFADGSSNGFNQVVANGEIQVGDEIQVSGITADFNGLHEITRIHGWEVLSSDNPLPEAQVIDLAELSSNGEEYESELVRLEFIQWNEPIDTLRSGTFYEVTNKDFSQAGWLSIPGSNNTEWAGQAAPQGLFSFEGILKEFFIPSLEESIYAITPQDYSDLETGLEFFSAAFDIPSFPGLLGESFIYPMSLTSIGDENIEGFEFVVNFNPDNVNINLGDQTGLLVDGFNLVSNPIAPGKIKVSGASANGISEIGIFMNFEIDLLGGGISDVYLNDISINEKFMDPVFAEVNVVLRRCGDVTGDETVSTLDATAVLRHTVFLSPEYPLVGLDSTAADVTGNGDISAFDASRILQYEVGLIDGLDCISLPIKKNPEVILASWMLNDSGDGSKSVNLDFSSSDFDVYSVEFELSLTNGTSFKGIKDLPKGWSMMQNKVEDRTLVSLFGATPMESKKLEFEFTSNASSDVSTIEAILTLNESTFTNLDKLTFSDAPKEFGLMQNYPNPFNPSTNIQYSLPEKGQVTLSIFNMLGQEVAEIVNTTQEPGNYTVTWDAGSLSSGVYIYRLTSAGASVTKRMLLIK